MAALKGFRNQPHKPMSEIRESSIGKRSRSSIKKPADKEEEPCTAYEFNFTGKVVVHSRADGNDGQVKLLNPNLVRQRIRETITKLFEEHANNIMGYDVLSDQNIHKFEIRNGDMFPLRQLRRNVYGRKK